MYACYNGTSLLRVHIVGTGAHMSMYAFERLRVECSSGTCSVAVLPVPDSCSLPVSYILSYIESDLTDPIRPPEF